MSLPSSRGGDGPSTSIARPSPSPSRNQPPENDRHGRRRLSVEEDLFYQQVMTASPRPPAEPPPPYRPNQPSQSAARSTSRPRQGSSSTASNRGSGADSRDEKLPRYSTDIDLEAVWEMKMEVVETVKRAEARQWRSLWVELRGTSLKFYAIRKDWGWHRAREWATTSSADHPAWARKAGLVRAYNLQHADVGIAADYKKRRNVIRLRLETDQLLIACVEPATLVKWLDALFTAIAIAHPLDERQFPVDQSVPRSQRSHWLRATVQRPPQRPSYPVPVPRPMGQSQQGGPTGNTVQAGEGVEGSARGTTTFGGPSSVGIRVETVEDTGSGIGAGIGIGMGNPGWMRRSYSSSLSSSLMSLNPDVDLDADPWPSPEPPPPSSRGSQSRLGTPPSFFHGASPSSASPSASSTLSPCPGDPSAVPMPGRASSPASSPLARASSSNHLADSRRGSTASSSSNAFRPSLRATSSWTPPLHPSAAAATGTFGSSRPRMGGRIVSGTGGIGVVSNTPSENIPGSNNGGGGDGEDDDDINNDNSGTNPTTTASKWSPTHERWTTSDDLRYARLCYAILLFRSPRKSQYVLQRNTKWFVDWETGRMVRVLPPAYGEIDRVEQERERRRGSSGQATMASQGLGLGLPAEQ